MKFSLVGSRMWTGNPTRSMERLYRTETGRYYLVDSIYLQGRHVSRKVAALWLVKNGHGVPTEIANIKL